MTLTFAPEKGAKLEEREEEPPNKWSGEGSAEAPGRELSNPCGEREETPSASKRGGGSVHRVTLVAGRNVAGDECWLYHSLPFGRECLIKNKIK